jgi:hypothetical protein
MSPKLLAHSCKLAVTGFANWAVIRQNYPVSIELIDDNCMAFSRRLNSGGSEYTGHSKKKPALGSDKSRAIRSVDRRVSWPHGPLHKAF